ncbi:MAG: phage antirepressor KilAC domain-containing protein [Wohlfahrtiimonas sp.]
MSNLINFNNEATMSSREIAELTEKQHQHVKRDILSMFEQLKIDASTFGHIYLDQLNREQTEYLLTKKHVECLITGYNIPLRMKVIDRLHELEANSKVDITKALNDPEFLRNTLTVYTEKVIHLEHVVEEIKPKAEGFDIISSADGAICITDTAKTLQVPPKKLFDFLSSEKWIYRRAGNKNWIAYQDKIQQQLLTHKITTIINNDGEEKVREQVLVTPKGIAKLSTLPINPKITVNQ